MFLIRTTLLLGLGVLVLPTDEASQARVYNGAKTAMSWTYTFCDRNPATCVHGREAWAVFVKKAEFGVKMAFDLISERNQQAAVIPTPPPTVPTVAKQQATPSRTVLKTSDADQAWRGKTARSGS